MRIGTIGTSWITEKFINSLLLSNTFKLCCVYSRDKEKALDFGKRFSCASIYTNLEEMAKSDIDAVYIASPNSLHHEHISLFIEQGKHVICEKPIVTSLAKYYDIYEKADKHGVFVFEAFRHLYTPAFTEISEFLKEISPLRNVVLNFNQYSPRYELYKKGEISNVFNPAFKGGALFDLGVYPLSLAIALFGIPIKSFYSPIYLENGVDGSGTFVLEYDGFLCNVTFSKLVGDHVQNQILGENGAILFDKPSDLTNIKFISKKAPLRESSCIYSNDFVYEMEIFHDVITKKDMSKYAAIREISLETMKIIDQAIS